MLEGKIGGVNNFKEINVEGRQLKWLGIRALNPFFT